MNPFIKRGASALGVTLVGLLLALDVSVRLSGPTAHAQSNGGDARERRRDATVRAVEKVGPTVANISADRLVVERYPPGFEQFFREYGGRGGERRSVSRSLGSGVIIDPAGYIVSNAHVVQRAAKIVVTLPDEREYEANLLSVSYPHDLALLKIEAGSALAFSKLGNSSDLMMGETVIALGNPFGLENTVTRGVISARDRKIKKDGRELDGTFLQTNAAINPGNSGGPLVNLDGELVGVNTAIHAGGQGIGFAIPADRVRAVLSELSDPEKLRDSWLGWRLEETKDGVKAVRVDEGGPAAQAGVQAGDVIDQCGAARATSVFEVHKQFFSHDGAVSLVLRGRDGAKRTIPLAPVASPARAVIEKRLGIQGRELTPSIAWKRGLDVETGVLSMGVTAGGPAARIGLEANDVVTKLGRKVNTRLGQAAWQIVPVQGTTHLAKLLDEIKKGEEIGVWVLRGNRELQGELRVD
ncbi:MAG: trypsin-like peptidase domain-containing protein [Planctomycetota bacterium]